jgi:hypothetical protein
MKYEKVVKWMTKNVPTFKLKLKAMEELQELSLILTQEMSKPKGSVTTEEIVNEIGDVQFRLDILKQLYSAKAIKARAEDKANKALKRSKLTKHAQKCKI